MKIDVVTLFPGVFRGPLDESMLRLSQERGKIAVRVVDLRDYAEGKHRVADDAPYGGGGGMVLKLEPLFRAVQALRGVGSRVILLDPRGQRFTQTVARELAKAEHLILLAGHYEGVDERVRHHLVDDELSIGDYVLTGGELPALVVIDAVVRLLPGVLGNEAAPDNDSFAGGFLEGPHYTRPVEFQGLRVPAVLLSGDHAVVATWRRRQALWLTYCRRPELLAQAELSDEERALIEAFRRGKTLAELDES